VVSTSNVTQIVHIELGTSGDSTNANATLYNNDREVLTRWPAGEIPAEVAVTLPPFGVALLAVSHQ
jgi:hypothetical protein